MPTPLTRADDFNRADSASSIGAPSDGLGGYTVSGTWGISGNAAYLASGAINAFAYLDTGATAGSYRHTFGGTLVAAGAIVRTDGTGGIVVAADPATGTTINVYSGGGYTAFGSTATTFAAGDTIQIDWTQPGVYTVSKNGTPVISNVSPAVPTVFNANTGVGPWSYADTSARFDDLSFTPAAGGGGGGSGNRRRRLICSGAD